ncbi:hypothetical protein A9G35_07630 [Gilliamella sp. Choc5-1]|uniref:hypothetical protein n=1 Tax=Gilliamella sp. Choc5-1 TaxID=3120238 RepID=UPI00080D9973|nr:hypothetical protein [Gilliamella apicola]OCG44865.1 hypothetical protein A9G35_07630 [Gilliamella apicola]
MQYHVNPQHWQTYALSLSNNAIRHVFTLFFLIPSTFWFKSPLKSFAKIALLALPLLSYSWQLQAANGNNNQVKHSDAIILNSREVINYARPELLYGQANGFAGPADIWNPNKGFLIQSNNPVSYSKNFPTTGANGLSFDLLIEGDVDGLIWDPVTHEGITATATRTVAYPRSNSNWWWLPPEEDGKIVIRVKLTGPEAKTQWENDNPRPIRVPKLPQTFELVGRDSLGNHVIKYGFVLQKWFVNRGNIKGFSPNQMSWCNSLGYRLSQVKDLTNQACDRKSSYYFNCSDGVDGAKPASHHNGYQRQIGAGLFTEWGDMSNYRDGDFKYNGYTTSEIYHSPGTTRDGAYYIVYSFFGNILVPANNGNNALLAVCVTP